MDYIKCKKLDKKSKKRVKMLKIRNLPPILKANNGQLKPSSPKPKLLLN